jgi:hypothetical protein
VQHFRIPDIHCNRVGTWLTIVHPYSIRGELIDKLMISGLLTFFLETLSRESPTRDAFG